MSSSHALEPAAVLGARDGLAIVNKDEVLETLWPVIGGKPRLIYGLAEMGTHYGHAFCAFETSDPATGLVEMMVPNIVGVRGEPLVQWISLREYLFGVSAFKGANKQRGIYNRPFTLLAISDTRVDTRAMRAYFLALDARNAAGEARFVLSTPRVLNVLLWPLRKLGLVTTEFGNCARYNCEGLKAGGVFDKRIGVRNFFTHNTMWPKRVALRIIQGESNVKADTVKVVHIPRVTHAKISAKGRHDGQTYSNVFTFLASLVGFETGNGKVYGQLANVADATITVPDGSMTAEVAGPASSKVIQ